jgi:4-hydroxybenzoate polyprenyltransferase
VTFFFLLFLWETGRNLTNDLADVTHDRLLGLTTLASMHGPRAAARVILGGGVAMIPIAVSQPTGWVVRALLVGVAVVTMAVPAAILHRHPDEPSAQRYFNRLTFFPPLAAASVIAVALVAALRA